MQEYNHGGDIYGNPHIDLDFSVSTNALGMPEAAKKALLKNVDHFTRYPDPYCRELSAAIALHEDVPSNRVVCGNGAADLIYRLCSALNPRHALIATPTFSEYERALNTTSCKISYHQLSSDNEFLLTAAIIELITTNIDLLFLCHPNNPTGRLIPDELLQQILLRARQTNTTVIIDECFLDFSTGSSSKQYLNNMPNLVVLKAFTKIYAMAGLRLGYILTANQRLAAEVIAKTQCWSVSLPAQIAGVAALTDKNWLSKTRKLVTEERSYLSNTLGDLGIHVFASDTNYLLCQSKLALYEPLLARGILIRPCNNFMGLDETYFRIGIKTRKENDRLVKAIREVYKEV
jgi:threonine-phosphate decarboxylase